MAVTGAPEKVSAFAGRKSELAEFNRLAREVEAGQGRFVIVRGEAGIGKTRLVKEAGKAAQEMGFDYLEGRCMAIGEREPYLPFTEALKGIGGTPRTVDSGMPVGLVGIGSPRQSYGTGQDIPLGLLAIAGRESADVASVDIQSERDRMFDSILGTIVRRSTSRPVMLFIDDLQWADSGTVQLLLFIARNIASSRVLLCTAYRTDEVDVGGGELPFYKEFKEAIRGLNYKMMTLDPLSRQDIAEIISSMLEIRDVPDRFVDKLFSEGEGNPFFVEEVLRSLMDEGIILRHGHIWDAGIDLTRIRIPASVQDVIGHRFARLDEDEKKVLRYAAVCGDTFTFDIIRKVTDMDDETLLDCLDRLIEADIICEVQDTEEEEYGFNHKMMRSVIYNSMSKSRVRLMHKVLGETIEELYGEHLEPWIFDLARHFSLGKEHQKAYEYSIKAGDKALASLAMDSAARYYETALKTLPFLPRSEELDRDAETLRLSMMMGNIYFSIGLWSEATRYYRNALDAARKKGDERAEMRALVSLGHSTRSAGSYTEAENHYEDAGQIAERLNDMQALGEIQRGLGYVHWRKGENKDAVEHYNQGISFSVKAGDISSMAKTFIELGNVYNHWGQFDKAIEYYSKSIEELEKLDDYSELARAYNNLGDTYLQMKNWEKAIESFDRCSAAADKIGNRNMKAWAMFNSSEALAHIGELDKAERYCLSALGICESQDDKIGMNGVFRCMGIIYRFKKDWPRAVENFNKSITILEMLDIPYDLADTYYQLGATYREMGDARAAADNFRMAATLFETVGAEKQAAEARKVAEALLSGESQG